MSIESVMPYNHLILCGHLLLLSSIFPIIKIFSIESVLCIRWPKYWHFSFGISPSKEYSGLISCRVDSFNHLAVQVTFERLQQHHNGCMRRVLGPGALGRPRGMGWRGRWERGSGWGTHVNPWLIHVNVWQNPLQYCKVISLQLIKINGKKKSINSSMCRLLNGPTLTSTHGYWKNYSFDYMDSCQQSNVSAF